MYLDLTLSDEPVWQISPYLAESLCFRDKEEIWLYVGSFKKRITVKIYENCRVMILDKKCALEMKISPGKWQIKREPDGVRLGPVIGIVCSKKTIDSASESILIRYFSCLKGGLCILLTPESFNKECRVIQGRTLSDEGQWFEAQFPWPDSLYIRVYPVKESFRKFLMKEFPHNHFNGQTHFNKWKIHQILEKYKEIQPYLPETARFTDHMEQLDSFLAKYKEVYLKPVYRNFGLGILKVSKDGDNFIVRYREHGENKVLHLDNTESIRQSLSRIMGIRAYIIQQGLDLSIKNRKRDLRVLVQKEADGLWKITAVTGREGAKDSIVSNVSNGGKLIPFKKVLEDSNTLERSFVNEIYRISITIAIAIEAHMGSIGEIGLDLGFDNHGKLWIIEANGLPQKELFLGYPAVEENVFSAPIQYAAYLAGFSEVVNPSGPTVYAPTNNSELKKTGPEQNTIFF